MKFSSKIAYLVAIMVLLLGVAVSYGIFYKTQQLIMDTISDNIKNETITMLKNVDMLLYERSSDIKIMANDNVLRSRNSTSEEITEVLLNYRNIQKYYISISVYDLNRVSIADTSGIDIGKQHPLAGYWLDPVNAKELTSGTMYSDVLKMEIIYFTYPVRDKEGNIFKIIVSRIPLLRLKSLLTASSTFIGASSEKELIKVDLVNRDGAFLVTSCSEKITDKEKVLYGDKIKNNSSRLKKEGGAFTELAYDEEGVKSLYAYSAEQGYLDYKGNNWVLVLHVPLKFIYAPARSLKNWVLLMTFIFMPIFILLSFYVTRKFTRPIAILEDAASHMGAGDLDFKPEIKTKDEIADLADKMYQMAQELKKSRSDLEGYSRNLESEVELRTEDLAKKVTELDEAKEVMLSVLEDVSESKKNLEITFEELKKTQGQLIQAGKLAGIGQMAAGIAHEINNPLTAILGFAQLIAKDKNIDETMRGDIVRIETEAKRCTGIIGNLLNFARPQTMRIKNIEINDVIEAALRILEYSIQMEKIQIIKKLGNGLPEIMADAQQLQQVFMNIMINAANAMPNGGSLTIATVVRSREFGVGSSELGNFIEISIADTGVGIPEDIKDKIFEPFFTTSYKRGFKGAGLGLSISHSIIKAHKGRIEFDSVVGKGTTFRVVLPVNGGINSK